MEFKVGDKVQALVGPHAGLYHEVIHVFPNGHVNIRPLGLRPKQIKYHLGAAEAGPSQIELLHPSTKSLNELL